MNRKTIIKIYFRNAIKKVVRPLVKLIVEEQMIPIKLQLQKIESELHPQKIITKDQINSVNKSKNFDYVGFESIFRGREDDIKKKQKVYLNFFKDKKMVLDVGCGRGEFLEILYKNSIPGLGVDENSAMVKICKSKRLKVVRSDAISYLGSLPNNSLDGIFTSHFIEHLDFNKLLKFVRLCFKKLSNKGIIVAETNNPHCFYSFKLFYLDPTHIKPLFPEFINFLFRMVGFKKTRIAYLNSFFQDKRILSENEKDIFDYPDYAIIANK